MNHYRIDLAQAINPIELSVRFLKVNWTMFELSKNNWGLKLRDHHAVAVPLCVCVTVYVILQHSTFENNWGVKPTIPRQFKHWIGAIRQRLSN